MIRLIVIIYIVFGAMPGFGQKQGIEGKVLWISGNQMPGPGKAKTAPKGILREIYVYKPTVRAQTKISNGLFTEITSELVARTTSKPDGSFCIQLRPGEYSVFTKEAAGWFANIYDAAGRINIVKVEPKKLTVLTIQVNYMAAY
jgi:hypothetical protein